MTSPPKRRKAGRVVRHTLADGTVKEYHYGPHKSKPQSGLAADSLSALLTAYQRSPEWNRLADVTRENYRIYLRTLDRVGHVRVQDIRRRDILTARDSIASTRGNGAAIGFVRAASALFAWAIDREWIEHNPAHRAARGLERGHLKAWSAEDARIALAGLPEHLRRVVILALYTGARRGDLCAMTWGDYDGRAIRFMPHKTHKRSHTFLVIPCHPVLKSELDAWQAGAVAGIASAPILTDAKGGPWSPNLLSHYLPAALVRIGLSNDINIHGLRKLAATNLAEAGCSSHEIAAVTGHRTLSMVELYTRSADQEKLAGAAIVRLSERKYKRAKSE